MQFSLANMDLVQNTNSDSFTSDYFDGGVFVSDFYELIIFSLKNFKICYTTEIKIFFAYVIIWRNCFTLIVK